VKTKSRKICATFFETGKVKPASKRMRMRMNGKDVRDIAPQIFTKSFKGSEMKEVTCGNCRGNQWAILNRNGIHLLCRICLQMVEGWR